MTTRIEVRHVAFAMTLLAVLAVGLLISTEASAQACANCFSCGGGDYKTTTASSSSMNRAGCQANYCTACPTAVAGADEDPAEQFQYLAGIPLVERVQRVEPATIFGYTGAITPAELPGMTLAELVELTGRMCPNPSPASTDATD